MVIDPSNLPGHRLKEHEALARQKDLRTATKRGAHGGSSRSAWVEVAVIIGAVAGISTVAGLLMAVFG